MSKTKSDCNIFAILVDSVKIYCTNFLKFTQYMAFPVLGQVLGLGLIFGLAFWYSQNLPALIDKSPAFNNPSTVLWCVILITVPGMIIFLKAFWDYLVAYGALNSMADSAMNVGKVYDFPAHNALVTNHTFKFVALWFVISLMSLIAVIPFFIVIGAIFFVYFILVFQVFVFEPDTSVIGCFKRSLNLIKGNFAKTFILMCVIAFFTHFLFVKGFSVFFDLIRVTELLTNPVEAWISANIPLDSLNNFLINLNPRTEILSPAKIAQSIVYQVPFFIVTGFTLPLRSICWTLWYKALNTDCSGAEAKKKSVRKNKKKESE